LTVVRESGLETPSDELDDGDDDELEERRSTSIGTLDTDVWPGRLLQ